MAEERTNTSIAVIDDIVFGADTEIMATKGERYIRKIASCRAGDGILSIWAEDCANLLMPRTYQHMMQKA